MSKCVHVVAHWVVICGKGQLAMGEQMLGESMFVPALTLHRRDDLGKILLELIEVQNGQYVGEDDIKRMEDDFHRLSRTKAGQGRYS